MAECEGDRAIETVEKTSTSKMSKPKPESRNSEKNDLLKLVSFVMAQRDIVFLVAFTMSPSNVSRVCACVYSHLSLSGFALGDRTRETHNNGSYVDDNNHHEQLQQPVSSSSNGDSSQRIVDSYENETISI